jgi:flagellar hook-basal body complex protein FliE
MDEIRVRSALTTPTGNGPEPPGASPRNRAGGGFLGSLKEAIAKANEIQLEASEAVNKLMTGESQNVHQTMIALQKADVSFQLMMQIRNKIISAYEEIQRMQV